MGDYRDARFNDGVCDYRFVNFQQCYPNNCEGLRCRSGSHGSGNQLVCSGLCFRSHYIRASFRALWAQGSIIYWDVLFCNFPNPCCSRYESSDYLCLPLLRGPFCKCPVSHCMSFFFIICRPLTVNRMVDC